VDDKDVTTTVMVGGVGRPDSVAPHSASRADWRILRDTILELIDTTPGAFLAAADQIKREPSAFREGELTSSTWALQEACFIESVWVAPCMRGNGVGERLVTYLIEQKRKAGIRKFYLWVFDRNTPAIQLYERMDFKPTGHPPVLLDPLEVQYLLEFDSDVTDKDELKRNATARKWDRKRLCIKYSMLTG
jgi:GNAT superfamily N-acetyltransferase